MKAYNGYLEEQKQGPTKNKQNKRKSKASLQQPVSGVFKKIQENFVNKLEELNEMSDLIGLILIRKYKIVANMMNEFDFIIDFHSNENDDQKMEKLFND